MKHFNRIKLAMLILVGVVLVLGVAFGVIAFPKETFAAAPFMLIAFGTVYSESNYISDVVLDEEGNLQASRDKVTVAQGQNLAIGTVLGKLSSGGQVKILTPDAHDGSETAYGVLVSPGGIDASVKAVDGVAITRLAILKSTGLVWPDGISDVNKATALAQLLAVHVQVRATEVLSGGDAPLGSPSGSASGSPSSSPSSSASGSPSSSASPSASPSSSASTSVSASPSASPSSSPSASA